MFNLTAVLTPTEEKTHHTYSVKGAHTDGRVQTQREDGKEVIFTPKRLQQLNTEGKLSIVNETTFTLKIDKDFNPNSGFTAIG